MRTIHTLFCALSLMICSTAIAQDPPSPPEAPNTKSEHSGSYSYRSIDTESGYELNISINNADDKYTMKSTFPKEKKQEVIDLLIAELGEEHLIQEKGKYDWGIHHDRNLVWEVELHGNKFHSYVDKRIASKTIVSKVEEVSEKFRALFIDVEQEEADRTQRDEERIVRDAERAVRDAERMEAEAERLRESAERDAERLRREAEKLRKEAEKLRLEAEEKE